MTLRSLLAGSLLGAALPALAAAAGPAPLSPTATAAALSPTAGEVYESAPVNVRARALPPQVSERSLSGDQARQVPGAAGDVIRAVGTLPGAVTPNDYLANLLVRGSGMDDNLIQLDGLPVAYPFHFGGLESVFHPGLIGEALFLPGGFDARFGDTMGGVLDLHTKRPEEGLHGEVGGSLIQAEALVSLAQGDQGWSAEGAWRQGTLQLVLGNNPAFAGLPAWQDWHAQLRGPAFGGNLRLMGYGSVDSLVAQGGPDASTSTWDSSFQSLGGVWQRKLQDWSLELRAWSSADTQSVDLGPQLYITEKPFIYGGLVELGDHLAGQHGLDLGAQWQSTTTQVSGIFNRVPLEWDSTLASDFNAATAGPVDDVSGAWIQDRWQVLPGAAMNLGGRIDYVDVTQEVHFSPRWSLAVDTWPGGTVKGAYGDYFQSPDPLQTVPGFSVQGLGSSLVHSYSAGVEQRLGAWKLEVEAYHKDFEQYYNAALTYSAGTGGLDSLATGWAEGAEALLYLPKVGPVQGWVSYAWSDVMRANVTRTAQGSGPASGWTVAGFYPGDFSQPQMFSLVLQSHLPWKMLLGARLHLASGIPYTPVASAVSSTSGSTTTWTATFAGTNSARLSPYERLDLRLEKRWEPEPALRAPWWKSVTAYLEAFNLTGAQNITAFTYNDDYSDIHRIPQFPRLAIAGADLAF
jgi:hypothetical protein